jgi:hypothetical protein
VVEVEAQLLRGLEQGLARRDLAGRPPVKGDPMGARVDRLRIAEESRQRLAGAPAKVRLQVAPGAVTLGHDCSSWGLLGPAGIAAFLVACLP